MYSKTIELAPCIPSVRVILTRYFFRGAVGTPGRNAALRETNRDPRAARIDIEK